MSIIDPICKKDYIIKTKQVRELLSECEIGPAFIEKANFMVAQMLIRADNRRKANKRKRIFPCDL